MRQASHSRNHRKRSKGAAENESRKAKMGIVFLAANKRLLVVRPLTQQQSPAGSLQAASVSSIDDSTYSVQYKTALLVQCSAPVLRVSAMEKDMKQAGTQMASPVSQNRIACLRKKVCSVLSLVRQKASFLMFLVPGICWLVCTLGRPSKGCSDLQ
jgi:hypothetical protein